MAVVNGRIPESQLAKIPGGKLRKPEAARWNAMCATSRRREGSFPMPNGPLSSYRPLAGQVLLRRQWCARGACQNAAVPGTSNHGWGRAVDNNNLQQCYRNGKAVGIRPPSDAPWENWHCLIRIEGKVSVLPSGPRTLKSGVRPGKDIRELQVMLRETGDFPKNRKVGTSFGPATKRAVKKFQKRRKMKADGIVGPKTLAEIRDVYEWHKKH